MHSGSASLSTTDEEGEQVTEPRLGVLRGAGAHRCAGAAPTRRGERDSDAGQRVLQAPRGRVRHAEPAPGAAPQLLQYKVSWGQKEDALTDPKVKWAAELKANRLLVTDWTGRQGIKARLNGMLLTVKQRKGS